MAAIQLLTPKELEVILEYCRYETMERTAEYLGVDVRTVSGHLQHIYAKLHVHRAHAAVYKLGLSHKSRVALDRYLEMATGPIPADVRLNSFAIEAAEMPDDV